VARQNVPSIRAHSMPQCVYSRYAARAGVPGWRGGSDVAFDPHPAANIANPSKNARRFIITSTLRPRHSFHHSSEGGRFTTRGLSRSPGAAWPLDGSFERVKLVRPMLQQARKYLFDGARPVAEPERALGRNRGERVVRELGDPPDALARG
jgi:hypothetical protein